MNGGTAAGAILLHQEQRIQELEAENKGLRAKLEDMETALQGAHAIIRHQRDRDSDFPGLENLAP